MKWDQTMLFGCILSARQVYADFPHQKFSKQEKTPLCKMQGECSSPTDKWNVWITFICTQLFVVLSNRLYLRYIKMMIIIINYIGEPHYLPFAWYNFLQTHHVSLKYLKHAACYAMFMCVVSAHATAAKRRRKLLLCEMLWISACEEMWCVRGKRNTILPTSPTSLPQQKQEIISHSVQNVFTAICTLLIEHSDYNVCMKMLVRKHIKFKLLT